MLLYLVTWPLLAEGQAGRVGGELRSWAVVYHRDIVSICTGLAPFSPLERSQVQSQDSDSRGHTRFPTRIASRQLFFFLF